MKDFKIKIDKQDDGSYQIVILDCPIAQYVGEFYRLTNEQIATVLKDWQRDTLPQLIKTTANCGPVNRLVLSLEALDPHSLTLKVVQLYLDQIITQAVASPNEVILSTISPLIEAYGHILFELFFRLAQNPEKRPTLEDRYRESLPEAKHKLRLKLLVSNQELHNLHWECLYDPSPRWPPSFLSLSNHTFIVRTAGATSVGPLSIEGPLRVLTVFANPNTRDYPDLSHEIEQEKGKLMKLAKGTQGRLEFFFLDEPDPGTFRRMRAAMQREKPHILYYFGHGDIDEKGGCLIGKQDQNKPTDDPVDRIRGDRLVTGLRGEAIERLRLVILNACRLAQRSVQHQWGISAFSDTVSSLLGMGGAGQSRIAAVIAMRFDIGADTASIFTEKLFAEFSNSLWENRALEEMLVKAREEVFNDYNSEWLIPVLFSRSEDGRIFRIDPQRIFHRAKMAFLRGDYAEAKRIMHEELRGCPQEILDSLH